MNKDTPKALDAVSEREAADLESKLCDLARSVGGIPNRHGERMGFGFDPDALLSFAALAGGVIDSTQQAAKSAAASAEQFVDGTSPDILDEGGTLVYFSRAAVLDCVEAALAAKSAAPAAVTGDLSDRYLRHEITWAQYVELFEKEQVAPIDEQDFATVMNQLSASPSSVAAFRRIVAFSTPMPATQAPAAVGLIAKRRQIEVDAMKLADSDGRFLNAQGHQQAIDAIDFCVSALYAPMPAGAAVGEPTSASPASKRP